MSTKIKNTNAESKNAESNDKARTYFVVAPADSTSVESALRSGYVFDTFDDLTAGAAESLDLYQDDKCIVLEIKIVNASEYKLTHKLDLQSRKLGLES